VNDSRTLLATCGLCASYGDFQAIFDIDFAVGAGETVAIIGANGAGKSTFLRAIIGSLPSAAEMVMYDGAPIGHLPAHDVVRLGIAMVPEGRKLFQSLSVEENLRISATLEKLNRVVNHSALASKFISLFYAELESAGTVVYCNAGHNPPLLWDGSVFRELARGGMILGPSPDSQYERGYETVALGSILVAYTDGIVEAVNASDEAFGMERLRAVIRDRVWASARDLVEAIFAEVRRHVGGDTRDDDQTVVAVLRKAKPVRSRTKTP